MCVCVCVCVCVLRLTSAAISIEVSLPPDDSLPQPEIRQRLPAPWFFLVSTVMGMPWGSSERKEGRKEGRKEDVTV